MLEEKLIEVKRKLIQYAGLVESMVEKSVSGLLNGDQSLLQQVMDIDEPAVNRFELEMDELCTSLIAQYQPNTRNLRVLLMTLRMSTDLERMGDHAVNIMQSGRFLIEQPPVKPLIDIPHMAELTIRMLRDGITAFVDENAPLATSVCLRDTIVDDLKAKIQDDLSEIMRQDPDAIARSLHLLRIAGNLERIADLSTNLCEDVLFMVQGRVIKHHAEENK